MPKQLDKTTLNTAKNAYHAALQRGLTHKKAVTAAAEDFGIPRRRVADWAKRAENDRIFTRRQIPTLQCKPQGVKAAVTGRGTVGKQQVKRNVNKRLRTQIKSPHEADAAAAAIAGLLHLKAIR